MVMRTFLPVVAAVCCGLISVPSARAQFRSGPDWSTEGGDGHRSSWIRSDPKISVAALQKPGFALAWKIKLPGEPGVAATQSSYIGYRGFRSLAFMGSASGEITTVDTDLGRIEWHKKLEGSRAAGAGPCSGGMTANVARPTTVAFPIAPPPGRGGGMGGRGSGAKSGVGEPNEGAVTIAPALAAAAAAAGRGPGLPPGGFPGGPGRGPRLPDVLSAISSDGMYHAMYISSGEEPNPPIAFLPPNANARDLTVVGRTAYAATSQGCGGAPNAIWALDLDSKSVIHWTPPSGDLAGGGFTLGPDNKAYVATTTGSLVALDAKKLDLQGAYRPEGALFSSGPVLFEYKTKAILAAPTNDGRIHLVDAVTLTGTANPAPTSGPLAAWQDSAGTQWILAPSKNSISAWKVQGDIPTLQPGWTSADIASPMAPIVVNGVVFAVSNSPNAVILALDGATGKELWNSGKTMTAAARIGSLSGSGSQLYLGTSDGMIYAFGFPIEH
jgi:outer membrane protein assembly factor BamB